MERCLEGGGQVIRSQSSLSDDDMSMMLSDNQPIMAKGLSSKNDSSFGLSQRRNSSFADFFDSEDFGQSLLSRRHFTWSHDERQSGGGAKKTNDEENFSVNDPGIFVNSCNKKTKEASTKKKLSKVQQPQKDKTTTEYKWFVFFRFCRRTGFSATLSWRRNQARETGQFPRALKA